MRQPPCPFTAKLYTVYNTRRYVHTNVGVPTVGMVVLNWHAVALPDSVAHVHASVAEVLDTYLEEDDLEVKGRRLERRAVQHVHDA